MRVLSLGALLALGLSPGASGGGPRGEEVKVGTKAIFSIRAEVGGLKPWERAEVVRRRVEAILKAPHIDPTDVSVERLPSGVAIIEVGGVPVVSVTPADAAAEGVSVGALARRWAERLKEGLVEAKPLYREGFPFQSLLIVALLAFLVPLLASRFKRAYIPIVVGEIVVGILVGRSGLKLVCYNPWLEFLAEFGFAYLMFLSGLEIDLSLIASPTAGRGRRALSPALVAVLAFFLSLLLALGIALLLVGLGMVRSAWMMALVLSTTSLGVVVPVLKERGLTRSPLGQSILLSALVADFATMLLITATAAVLSGGASLEVLMGLLVLAIFGTALRVGRAAVRAEFISKVLAEVEHATSQIQVRGALALMLAFVALSQWLGVEVILGAFLAGLLISILAKREGSELLPKLEALGFGFFIPIFFIMVGAKFDLGALLSAPRGPWLVLLLVASAFLIKMVSALPLRFLSSWREALAGGVLLSARLSLIIAAAEIGTRLGILTEAVNSAIILVALVTCLVSPTVFSHIRLAPAGERRGAVIVGAGELGILLAQRLSARGIVTRVVESYRSRAEAARRAGVEVVLGDGRRPEVLLSAGAEEAEVVVAATSDDSANEEVCNTAERLGVPERVALVRDGRTAERLRERGTRVVTPSLSTLFVLEGMVVHPATFEVLAQHDPEKRIVEIPLTNRALAGRALRELDLPGDALVLLIRRNGETLIPHGHTVLVEGDVLTIIGSEDSIVEAEALLSGAD